MSWKDDLGELVTPWFATGSGLNTGEDAEIARFRLRGQEAATRGLKPWETPPASKTITPVAAATAAAITTDVSNVVKKEGSQMAGQAIVQGAKRALQLVKDNPQVTQKLSSYYEKATGKSVDFTTSAGLAAVNRGPAPAAVVLRGIVSAGVNPDEIFDSVLMKNQRDAASLKIIADLQTLFSNISNRLNSQAVIRSTGGLPDRLFNKSVITFAQRRYGTPAAIREAHAKMRAFMAMDTEVLEETIALHLG